MDGAGKSSRRCSPHDPGLAIEFLRGQVLRQDGEPARSRCAVGTQYGLRHPLPPTVCERGDEEMPGSSNGGLDDAVPDA